MMMNQSKDEAPARKRNLTENEIESDQRMMMINNNDQIKTKTVMKINHQEKKKKKIRSIGDHLRHHHLLNLSLIMIKVEVPAKRMMTNCHNLDSRRFLHYLALNPRAKIKTIIKIIIRRRNPLIAKLSLNPVDIANITVMTMIPQE